MKREYKKWGKRKEERKRKRGGAQREPGSSEAKACKERGETKSGRGEARREFILAQTALVSLPGRKRCPGELSTGGSGRDGHTALPGPALGCSEHPESGAERGWGHGGRVIPFPYPDGLARGGQ